MHPSTSAVGVDWGVIRLATLSDGEVVLQVKNLSKLAEKNVKAKSGLNRAILDASPFALRRQLEYKALWREGC